MNVRSSRSTSNEPSKQNHISLFYDSDAQRLEFLRDYLQVGFERNELCIVVTHQSQQELAAELLMLGLAVNKHIRNKSLRIFNAHESYLAGESFVVDYMLSNMTNFISDATDQGYSGLRTAGEMNWVHEHEVSGLDSKCFSGLCLYPISNESLQAIQDDETSLWLKNLALEDSNPSTTVKLSNSAIKKVLLGAGLP